MIFTLLFIPLNNNYYFLFMYYKIYTINIYDNIFPQGDKTVKQHGLIYSNFNELQLFIKDNKIDKMSNILIQVFTGNINKEFIRKLISQILYLLPFAEIIGSTTAGEIYRENVYTDTTVISFTSFESTVVKTILLENNHEHNICKNAFKSLVAEDTKAVILFADGFTSNCRSFVKGIHKINKNVVVCGGKAGDNGYLKETFVFTKDKISSNGIAAASLTGKELKIVTENSFGWLPIGKVMTVTKAEDNRVFTIDNVKASEIYRKYLGDEIAKGLPMSATEFPLILSKNDISIARVVYDLHEDGSLSFLGDINTGDKIQLGYGNINDLVRRSSEIAERIKEESAEAIFVYSCSVRRSFMQDKANLEIKPLNCIAHTYGFFTYGEFFINNNILNTLNLEMTILGLSEGENKKLKKEIMHEENRKADNFFEGKELGVIKAFTNLVNATTLELGEANKVLEKQKFMMEQLNNITKTILEINSEMLASGQFDKLLDMTLGKVLDIIPHGKMGSITFVENDNICFKAVRGHKKNKINNLKINLSNTYPYLSNTYNEFFIPRIFNNLEEDIFVNKEDYYEWKMCFEKTPRQMLCCGIGIDGEFVGIINLLNTEKQGDFDKEDMNLLKYFCYDLAIAIKNARLLESTLYMSKYDSLTGVYNRHYFIKILGELEYVPKTLNKSFSICIIDLNNLKRVNDNYGHNAGDNFIKKFADNVRKKLNKSDVIARTGGDEFTIIFTKKDVFHAKAAIEKICESFKNELLDINGKTIEISFAYGISEYKRDSEDVSELLNIADKRMYEKKRLMKEELQ